MITRARPQEFGADDLFIELDVVRDQNGGGGDIRRDLFKDGL